MSAGCTSKFSLFELKLTPARGRSIQVSQQSRHVHDSDTCDAHLAGVIAYEAITDACAFGFSKKEQVMACARGERSYAWEPANSTRPGGSSNAAFERSRVRSIVLQCLARDPSERPTASQLVRAIDRISNATRTATLAEPEGASSVTVDV